MPKIPVPMGDLPTEGERMPENIVYRCIVRDIKAGGVDKRGHEFLKFTFEVMEPDEFKGRKIFDNYVPIPNELDGSMTEAERKKELEVGVTLARIAAACKVGDSDDTDDLLGQTLEIKIRNEEYPEGSGRFNPRPESYLI